MAPGGLCVVSRIFYRFFFFFCFMESDSVCGYLQICFVSAVLYKFIGLIDLEYFWVTR